MPEMAQVLFLQIDRLSDILWPDEPKPSATEAHVQQKLAALTGLVDVMKNFVDVFKQFILVRVAEITTDDLGIIIRFVTRDDILKTLCMIEEFRDEASYVRAVKALSVQVSQASASVSSVSSWNVIGSCSSGKAYLFQQSVDNGASSMEVISVENPGEQDGDDYNLQDQSGQGHSRGRGKRSHRQRKRKQKFWKSLPCTNSSHS